MSTEQKRSRAQEKRRISDQRARDKKRSELLHSGAALSSQVEAAADRNAEHIQGLIERVRMLSIAGNGGFSKDDDWPVDDGRSVV